MIATSARLRRLYGLYRYRKLTKARDGGHGLMRRQRYHDKHLTFGNAYGAALLSACCTLLVYDNLNVARRHSLPPPPCRIDSARNELAALMHERSQAARTPRNLAAPTTARQKRRARYSKRTASFQLVTSQPRRGSLPPQLCGTACASPPRISP